MNTRLWPPFFAAIAAIWPLAAHSAPATPQATLDGAVRTVAALHASLGGSILAVSKARAVLVAPSGAGAGTLLLLHGPTGWSEPAFFDSASLTTRTPTVLLLMTDRAVDAVLQQRGLRFDPPDALTVAALTVAALGGKPGGGAGSDLLLWPGPRAALNDTGFHQDDAANAMWYGRPRDAAEIVGGTPPELRSSALRRQLAPPTRWPRRAAKPHT
jgi:hypothetical protein